MNQNQYTDNARIYLVKLKQACQEDIKKAHPLKKKRLENINNKLEEIILELRNSKTKCLTNDQVKRVNILVKKAMFESKL